MRQAVTSQEQSVAGSDTPASTALCDQAAVTLRRMIEEREILPSELLESCIARIEEVNPQVNAVVATDYARARAAAASADAASKSGAVLPPLHGLPVLVKDLTDTAGLRTTYGSLCHKDHVPASDAPIVRSLKDAGAILLGKTNTPEFGAGANTVNGVYGATRNPYNSDLTAGGSSGGSAAAIACGMAPLATGSDLGGSLRIPASFCGVVGMRPSPGFVPSNSHNLGFSPLWTDGPMARSVEDVAACLDVLVGYDARDPLSTPSSRDCLSSVKEDIDLSGLKVGFSADLGFASVDADIAAVFERKRTALSSAFSSASELSLDLSEAAEIFPVLRAQDVYAGYDRLDETKRALVGANVRANVLEAERYSLADTARAGALHTDFYRRFQALFNDVDLLICPATAVSPFPVVENHPTAINGVQLESYYSWYAITWALSLVGCPVIALPCGLDHNNMPFGIQVVAARFNDAMLLRVARALEQRLAGG